MKKMDKNWTIAVFYQKDSMSTSDFKDYYIPAEYKKGTNNRRQLQAWIDSRSDADDVKVVDVEDISLFGGIEQKSEMKYGLKSTEVKIVLKEKEGNNTIEKVMDSDVFWKYKNYDSINYGFEQYWDDAEVEEIKDDFTSADWILFEIYHGNFSNQIWSQIKVIEEEWEEDGFLDGFGATIVVGDMLIEI